MKIITNNRRFILLSTALGILIFIVFYPFKFSSIPEKRSRIQMAIQGLGRMFYERGGEFCDQKEYDSCLRESWIATKLDQKLDGAYCNLGVAYFKKGDYERASFYFEKAYEINPHRFATRNNLVLTYEKLLETYVKNGKDEDVGKVLSKMSNTMILRTGMSKEEALHVTNFLENKKISEVKIKNKSKNVEVVLSRDQADLDSLMILVFEEGKLSAFGESSEIKFSGILKSYPEINDLIGR